MEYLFKCTKCGKLENKNIKMADYDVEKNNQKCTCGAGMERVIEAPAGISLCGGMYGIDGKGGWNE